MLESHAGSKTSDPRDDQGSKLLDSMKPNQDASVEYETDKAQLHLDTDGASPTESDSVDGCESYSANNFANLSLDKPMISLRSVRPEQQPLLFVKYLTLCMECFDPMDMVPPEDDPVEFDDECENKDDACARYIRRKRAAVKTDILLDLVDHLGSTDVVLNESSFPYMFAMVGANIFRCLPPRVDFGTEGEECEPVFDEGWPHLQIVYEIFLRFIMLSQVEPKAVKSCISYNFLLQLMNLFESCDPREREYSKTILHRIYGKFMGLRTFIRKSITNVFLYSIYVDQHHTGIEEYLEIMGSVINGFAVPLKAEHKRFLEKGLLPLHRIKNFTSFYHQLEYCVTQFIEKDRSLSIPVINALMKYWPEMSSPNQVMFLQELEEVLELCSSDHFGKILEPLIKRLCRCIESRHCQISERALMLWSNKHVFNLMTEFSHAILPIAFEDLQRTSEFHWNSTVRNLCENVLQYHRTLDETFFEELSNAVAKQEITSQEASKEREAIWDKLMVEYKNSTEHPGSSE